MAVAHHATIVAMARILVHPACRRARPGAEPQAKRSQWPVRLTLVALVMLCVVAQEPLTDFGPSVAHAQDASQTPQETPDEPQPDVQPADSPGDPPPPTDRPTDEPTDEPIDDSPAVPQQEPAESPIEGLGPAAPPELSPEPDPAAPDFAPEPDPAASPDPFSAPDIDGRTDRTTIRATIRATNRATNGDAPIDDPTFGPVLVIERIDIEGNSSTAERLIRRALLLVEGDVLRAGDPRFQKARFKLLAMGFFREVELDLRKGSEPGKVILVVQVKERGTVVLNNLYFGNSPSSPWWVGVDLTERNFFGTGLGVGGGVVYAGNGDIDGSEDQLALRLRLFDTSILGSIVGAYGSILHNRGSEPYRIQGETGDASAVNFRAFSYTRTGLQTGITLDLTPLSNLDVGGRLEWVDADVPLAPTRTLTDGSVVPVDIGIEPGRSRVVSLSLGFDRDTRSDPVLPYNGSRVVVIAEFGATWMGGSYNYAVALARYDRWWPVRTRKHILSVHLTGGLVLGEAPRFERLHASDFSRLLASRSHGLVMSTNSSPDFLGTEADESTYGEVGGSAMLEYSYQLFRSRFGVYGGDLFIGAGVWALADRRDLSVREGSLYRALPVDLVFDAGLRIDTKIGIFELTFANAFGRLPF